MLVVSSWSDWSRSRCFFGSLRSPHSRSKYDIWWSTFWKK